ncbi:HDOD domain-containing protein [Pseudomonadota bacterium]
MESQLLSKFMDDINNNRLNLPTLPEIAMKVRKMVQDPNTSAAQISVVIGSDPALSAKLLQVSNSALYRGTQQIENVQHAITRLGSNVVRNIVTGIVMAQLYQPPGNKYINQRLKGLWLHSTKVAAISHVMARQHTKLKPDQAMLGGLIHDIGAIPVFSEASNIPELLEDENLLNRIVYKLHNLVGTSILDEWNFPQELIDIVSNHEDLDRDSGSDIDYVDVVTVANILSYIGTSHRLAKLEWTEIPAFKKFGLSPEQSIKAMEEAQEEVAIIQRMFTS